MPTHTSSITEESHHADRRRGHRGLALLVALVLAIGAVACGSGDDSGGGSGGSNASEPLSKSDYLEQVNEAQTDFATDAGKLNLANPSSPGGFKKSLDQLVVLIDDLETELDDIQPPDEVDAEHDRLVAGLSDYGDTIEAQKDGLSSGDRQQVVSAAQKIGTASTTFSRSFDGTIDEINSNLE